MICVYGNSSFQYAFIAAFDLRAIYQNVKKNKYLSIFFAIFQKKNQVFSLV